MLLTYKADNFSIVSIYLVTDESQIILELTTCNIQISETRLLVGGDWGRGRCRSFQRGVTFVRGGG